MRKTKLGRTTTNFAYAMAMMIFISSFALAAPRALLGSVDHWYANENTIYRVAALPIIAESTTNGGFDPAKITSFTNHAKTTWTSAGMPMIIASEFRDANVLVYAGTFGMMKIVDPGLESGTPGRIVRTAESYEGEWDYKGSYKTGYKNYKTKVVAVWDNENGDKLYNNQEIYKNIILHEIGHALGWQGHSTNTADVMHETASSAKTNLTTRDIMHVRQVKGY